MVDQVVHIGLGKGLFAAFVVVVLHRVVEHLALLAGEFEAGAHAVGAPAVFAVVREQARVELGIAGGAHRASAQSREHLQLANALAVAALRQLLLQATQLAEHMHHAFAQLKGAGERGAQFGLLVGLHWQACHGQFNGVFLKAVDARKTLRGQKRAIDPQVGVAAWARPVGQLGVHAFAVEHQRRE